MPRTLGAALFVLFVTCLHGCATMMYGRTQIVAVDSLPKGATVRIEPGSDALVTPCLVALARKSPYYVVHVEKEKYEPASVTLVRKASSSLWRNAVWIHPVGWIIGVTVDLITGAGYDLNPEKVEVTLVPSADIGSNGAVESDGHANAKAK